MRGGRRREKKKGEGEVAGRESDGLGSSFASNLA
jgi:hypothetical protein